MNIKISLVDNDYVIRAETDLTRMRQDDPIRRFLQQMKEELVPGQTAYLEIEGFETNPITFEISQAR